MRLNIQYFADDATITYDKQQLEEVKQKIDKIASDVDEAFAEIVRQIKYICDGENFDAETQQLLREVLEMIEGKKNQYVASLGDMSGFLTSLISLFTANEGQISNEIKEWLTTFKSAGEGLKKAYTAEGATQGAETVKAAAQEMVNSGVKISGYTRGIVNETVNIIANGGKAIKGITGSSPQQIVQKGIGTIATLFGNAGSNPGGTIVSQLFGKLGSGFASWFTA
jgi:hypothetical protein